MKDDSELFNIKLNLNNQKVIHKDCDRTRSLERKIQFSFVEYAEYIITYYCKKHNFKYKQGLNEIVGPFVLIKQKLNISFSKLYNLFVAFVDKFLTNYFLEDEFFSLQSSLSLLNILLNYHDPEIKIILDNSYLTPEVYATSWILTVFAK